MKMHQINDDDHQKTKTTEQDSWLLMIGFLFYQPKMDLFSRNVLEMFV